MPFRVIIEGDPPYECECMNCGARAVHLPSECLSNECSIDCAAIVESIEGAHSSGASE